MKATWLALCTVSIASFLAATPALADWKNFGLGNSPTVTLPVQGAVGAPSEQQDGLGAGDGLNELGGDVPLDIPLNIPAPEDTGNLPQGPSSDLRILDLEPEIAQVPEPATIALMAQCLICLAWASRRKR